VKVMSHGSYGDVGQYTVTVDPALRLRATDVSSSVWHTFAFADEGDVAPAVTNLTGMTLPSVTESSSTGPVVVASFTSDDVSASADDFAASVDWGDGATSAVPDVTIVANVDGGFDVVAGHAYDDTGTYAIGVTVTEP